MQQADSKPDRGQQADSWRNGETQAVPAVQQSASPQETGSHDIETGAKSIKSAAAVQTQSAAAENSSRLPVVEEESRALGGQSSDSIKHNAAGRREQPSDSIGSQASVKRDSAVLGQRSHASLNGLDLSDPTGYELLLDDNPDDDTRLQEAQKRLLSIDIANQKGVQLVGNRVSVPGRVPLMLITLMQILFSVIGLSFGFIHFSALAHNYLFPFAVLQILLFIQIGLYHSSYRAKRTVQCGLITLASLGIMTFVDWAFIDLIVNPPDSHWPSVMLKIAMGGFTAIPVLMLLHLVFLGRGKREIAVRRRKDNPNGSVLGKAGSAESSATAKPSSETSSRADGISATAKPSSETSSRADGISANVK